MVYKFSEYCCCFKIGFMAPNVEFEEIIIDRETGTLFWEK